MSRPSELIGVEVFLLLDGAAGVADSMCWIAVRADIRASARNEIGVWLHSDELSFLLGARCLAFVDHRRIQ